MAGRYPREQNSLSSAYDATPSQQFSMHRTTGAAAFRSTRLSAQDLADAKEKRPANDLGGQFWTKSKAGRKSRRLGFLVLLFGILIGVVTGGLRVGVQILGYFKEHGKYCLVFEDNFDAPLNTTLWTPEVSVGGFGNEEFSWTTSSPRNAYTEDGMLHIVPTLTADLIGEANLLNGYTVNLTADGTCTTPEAGWPKIDEKVPMQLAINSTHTNCVARSNATLGTIIPSIQSARLTTKHSAAIRYGRVEVRARMPTGDWLWPAVWMMPRDSVYGEWPRSGEIDIFEARGNAPKKRYDIGSNVMASLLHHGFDKAHNLQGTWKAYRFLYRKFYNEEFHTFGVEWDEHGIWTWEGSRSRRVLDRKFSNFASQRWPEQHDETGTLVPAPNPWLKSNSKAAPFDQYFYLILNVAVGGSSGYFSGGPWSNADPLSARAFWTAREQTWLPTWPQDPKRRGMMVDYVKMWQRCG